MKSLLADWLIDWLHIYKVLSWRSFPHVMQKHTRQHVWSKGSTVRAEMLYCHQLRRHCRSPQHLRQLRTLSSDHIQSHTLNQSGSGATGFGAVYILHMNAAVAERKSGLSWVTEDMGQQTTWICLRKSVSCFRTLKVPPDTFLCVILYLVLAWRAWGR